MITPKCKYCKNEAIWAMQFIAEAKPSFYALGWHIRGFSVTKVCDDHFNFINDAWQKSSPVEQKDFFDWVNSGMLNPLG